MERYKDLVNYMTGVKVESSPPVYGLPQPPKMIASVVKYKKQLFTVLIKAEMIEHALYVCTLGDTANLSYGFLDSKVSIEKFPGCFFTSGFKTLLHEMDFPSFQDILRAVMGAKKTSSSNMDGLTSNTETVYNKIDEISQEKAKFIMSFVLSGVQLNNNLKQYLCMEWLLDTCSLPPSAWSWNESKQETVRRGVFDLVRTAKSRLLKCNEIKCEAKVPFKVFIVELLAALVATVHEANRQRKWKEYSLATQVMVWFKNKDLLWACITMLVSPQMQNCCDASHIEFALKHILPVYGSNCISFNVYNKWCGNLKGEEFESCLKLVQYMMKEGKATRGRKGEQLMSNAVKLAWRLTTNISLNHKSCNKEKLVKMLCQIKDEFAKDGKKYGCPKFETVVLELNFTLDPGFENLEALKQTCKPEEWAKSRINWLSQLRTRSRKNSAACFEVFGLSEMFAELKTLASSMPFSDDHPAVCKKIKEVIEKLKKSSDQKAAQFVSACSSWLAVAMCKSSFQFWKRTHPLTITTEMVECMKALYQISPTEFNSITKDAIYQVCSMFLCNTVHEEKRRHLREWLKSLKKLYLAVGNNVEWSREFYNLKNTLKKKPAVTRELSSCHELTNGNSTWQHILKVDREREVERMKKDPQTPKPFLSQPAPSKSGPFQPAPSKSGPSQPAPSKSVPSQPAPSKSGPSQPDPSKSGPSQPAPSKSGPSQPAPSKSGPSQPAPSKSGPSYPAPSKSGPSQPAPSKSGPSQPAPSKSGPSQPAPSKSGPSQPAPSVSCEALTIKNKTIMTRSTSHSKADIVPATTLKENLVQNSGAAVTANSDTNQTLVRKNALRLANVSTQIQSSSQAPVPLVTFNLKSSVAPVAPNLNQTLTVQNLNKNETTTPQTQDLALVKITPLMADNLAKGLTVPIPDDVIAINGLAPHSRPLLRIQNGKVMMTIPNGAEVSSFLPRTSSANLISTTIPRSTTPALPLTSTVTDPNPLTLKSNQSANAPLPAISTQCSVTTKPSTNN